MAKSDVNFIYMHKITNTHYTCYCIIIKKSIEKYIGKIDKSVNYDT